MHTFATGRPYKAILLVFTRNYQVAPLTDTHCD